MAKRRIAKQEDSWDLAKQYAVAVARDMVTVAADQSAALMPEIEPEQPAPIPPGFRRFALGEGVSLSHGQHIYMASPEGWVDLPSGEGWYLPLIQTGVLKERFE